MAKDTNYRSYKKIIKEYYNNASRLDTKAGISLLFIKSTYLFLYIKLYCLLSDLMPIPTGFITCLFLLFCEYVDV